MPYLYLGFSALWLTILGLALRQIKAAKREIAFLPPLPSKKLLTRSVHPCIGKNMRDIISADYFNDSFTVVAVTLPTCSFCHSALEEFLEDNKTIQLPLINLLVTDNEEDALETKSLYENAFPTLSFSDKLIQPLSIDRFPEFLLIDQYGEIVHESGWGRIVLKQYQKILKGGEKYVG